MEKNLIYIIEDEQKLSRTIKDFLTIRGYMTLCAFDGKEAIKLFNSERRKIDLVLLDLTLPKVDGLAVLREIRRISDVPVIILSARSAVEDQMDGFSIGADDYMTKPFTLDLMEMHIEAVLKRAGKQRHNLEYGDIFVDLDSQNAFYQNKGLELTRKEYDLLVYFMEHRETVLTRNAILDAVWGYEYTGDMRTVDTQVKQLRKKLGDDCDYIQSVYGAGYLFGKKES